MTALKHKARPKVFDVTSPDKAAADSTSRPLIVGNRPLLQDPMMVVPEAPGDNLKTAPPLKPEISRPAPSKVLIQPIIDETSDGAAGEPTDAGSTAKVTRSPSVIDPSPQSAGKPVSAPPAAELEPAATGKTPDEEVAAKDEAELKHAADLENLVESKQYFLPINAVEHRRSRRSALAGILLVVVLAMALADIALDAGLVSFGHIQPLTHFFHN